jgi:hypothetical protein
MMSFIQVIEQLGANAALQQLNQAQLMAMFQNAESNTNQLETLLKGNVEELSDLLQVPVYRCVMEVPAEQEEKPGEQEEEKTKPSIHLQ